ncbi:MAG: hypothetical protein GY951_01730 [Psychromonas sp.]|nr:hypothetical protein [Alteromonadales bacterium]MCP5076768.1 hypothetical protein [Psychromonas sp.]
MDNLHTTHILPNQQAIESVASLSNEFSNHQFETEVLLTHLKDRVLETHFMDEQDHAIWMVVRGADFIANPKLFSLAPLTYACVFLGELFNNLEIEQIQQQVPTCVIEQALLRLQTFTLH